MSSILKPFDVQSDLRRYGDNLLSPDADKSLDIFTIFIYACVLADSGYIAFISYASSNIVFVENPIVPYLISTFTLITFSYIFVGVDKAIVTSDLFSEEKIREYSYKEINFFRNTPFNKVINFIYHTAYLLSSPIRYTLSANPFAAMLLSVRVIFMVTIHIGVLAFVFLFTSGSIKEQVINKNKMQIVKINKIIEQRNSNLIKNDPDLQKLQKDRSDASDNRLGEARGTFNKRAYGPGNKYKIYDSEVKRLDHEIYDRTVELTNKGIALINLEKNINYANPAANVAISNAAASAGVELFNDNIENRAKLMFDSIKNDRFGFFSMILPTIGMSLLLIAPLFILVLMKVFQNKSTRLYYDPELQSHFKYYLDGSYNWLLSEDVKKPNGKIMLDSLVFSDIYYEVIKKYSKTLNKSMAVIEEKEIYKISDQIKAIERRISSLENENSQHSSDIEELSNGIKEKEGVVMKLSSGNNLNEIFKDIEEMKSKILSSKNIISSNIKTIGEEVVELEKLKIRYQKHTDNKHLWSLGTERSDEAKFIIAGSMAALITFLSKEFLDYVEIQHPHVD